MFALWMLSAPHAEVVDAVLRVVGDRIVTRSDVAFEQDLDPRDQSPIAALEDPAYAYEQRVVDFAILRQLAGEIEIYRPSPTEVRERWERFRKGWPNDDGYAAFLARWGMEEDQLLGFFYSRLVVERFVARNAAEAGAGSNAIDVPTAAYQSWMAELRARATIRTPR